MANLDIGSVIQESLIYESDDSKDPGLWDKTKEKGQKAVDWVKANPKKSAAGAAAVAGLVGGGAYLRHKHNANKQSRTNRNIAMGSLAAIGAGVGIKALLKHLKKKRGQ